MQTYKYAYLGTSLLVRDPNIEHVVNEVLRSIRLQIATRTPQHVFVHAGVVSVDGRVALLPGRSRSGKTTLVAEMMRLGGTYFSDEFAVLDERGWVHPFAQPLLIRTSHETRRAIQPVMLGGAIAADANPVAAVIFTEFHPNAMWRPQILSRGEAVMELLRHTVNTQLDPQFTLRTLAALVSHARAFTTARPEAGTILSALTSTLRELDSA